MWLPLHSYYLQWYQCSSQRVAAVASAGAVQGLPLRACWRRQRTGDGAPGVWQCAVLWCIRCPGCVRVSRVCPETGAGLTAFCRSFLRPNPLHQRAVAEFVSAPGCSHCVVPPPPPVAWLVLQVADFGKKQTGLDQYAIARFAEALEVVPRTIAENSGLPASEVVARLYAAHSAGQVRLPATSYSSTVLGCWD